MTESGQRVEELLRLARAGDREALGQLLDRHRCWLQMLSFNGLQPGLRARVGESDLIQQTILSALRAFPNFGGGSTLEFQEWLKQIHDRNILDTVRFHQKAKKRSVGQERPIDVALLGGSPHPAMDEPSPSECALFGERAIQLARALEQLPPDQSEAVRLRHIEGRSLDEVQKHFGRSQEACAGLIKRGLRNLRRLLEEP